MYVGFGVHAGFSARGLRKHWGGRGVGVPARQKPAQNFAVLLLELGKLTREKYMYRVMI